jgi:transcription elongation factor GreB
MNTDTDQIDDTELDDEDDDTSPPAGGGINYVTPQGYKILEDERHQLQSIERPKVVETVSWAAGNGDRSENGDYIYGKKRLRQIDGRIRFLNKRMKSAHIINPADQKNHDQVFFGATVTYEHENGDMRTLTIVGVDEADFAQKKVSWVSPIAKAFMKSCEGDYVDIRTPGGLICVEIRSISYDL